MKTITLSSPSVRELGSEIAELLHDYDKDALVSLNIVPDTTYMLGVRFYAILVLQV